MPTPPITSPTVSRNTWTATSGPSVTPVAVTTTVQSAGGVFAAGPGSGGAVEIVDATNPAALAKVTLSQGELTTTDPVARDLLFEILQELKRLNLVLHGEEA